MFTYRYCDKTVGGNVKSTLYLRSSRGQKAWMDKGDKLGVPFLSFHLLQLFFFKSREPLSVLYTQ